MGLNIHTGKILKPQKVVIYGPEGIGKSTLASHFPDPLFIDTEGSTNDLDVKRLTPPTSWAMLMSYVAQVKEDPTVCRTLVIDTADWAEKLCSQEICDKNKVDSIEGFGYGKGYVYLEEEFGRLLNRLSDLIDKGINVVLTAHAMMRKFEQPDESGAYDRWELKLQKKISPLVKEWADMVLFANYETMVIKEKDSNKGKARGGKRVLHTTHHPCWDAKNRKGLPDKIDMDYAQIASVIPNTSAIPVAEPETPSEAPAEPEAKPVAEVNKDADKETALNRLFVLMNEHDVSRKEIEDIVSDKGYFPVGTPMENYPEDFISGVLIGAWADVHKAILDKAIPF